MTISSRERRGDYSTGVGFGGIGRRCHLRMFGKLWQLLYFSNLAPWHRRSIPAHNDLSNEQTAPVGWILLGEGHHNYVTFAVLPLSPYWT